MTNKYYHIQIDILLKAPVIIAGSIGDENMVTSEDYISGATLIGAFAAQYIKNNEKDISDDYDEFHKLFLSGKLKFLNGYPMRKDSRLLPIPRSIQVEKANAEKVQDLLFTELTDKNKSQVEPTKYKDGYCILSDDYYSKANVTKQHQFHHERTNQRVGRSASSEIFNYESIHEGQCFRSFVLGSKEDLNKFVKIFQNENIFDIRLGRSKNTQYGKAQVKIGSEPAVFDAEYQFNNQQNEEKPKKVTTLTFLSDVILLDKNGTSRVCTKLLADHLGIDEKKIEKSFIRSKTVENYIAVWKARTPALSAFEKGSCFKIRGDLPEETITTLEEEGLGVKRNEGYGRVAVNWQTSQIKPLKMPDNAQETDTVPPNDFTKSMLQNLVHNYFKDQIEQKAAGDVEKLTETYKDQKIKLFEGLSATQIQRLKSFTLGIHDNKTTFEIFKARITRKTTSNEKLANIKYNKDTFLNFLEKDPWVDLQKDILAHYKNSELIEPLSLNTFIEQNRELYCKHYYATLFTLLAKNYKDYMRKEA